MDSLELFLHFLRTVRKLMYWRLAEAISHCIHISASSIWSFIDHLNFGPFRPKGWFNHRQSPSLDVCEGRSSWYVPLLQLEPSLHRLMLSRCLSQPIDANFIDEFFHVMVTIGLTRECHPRHLTVQNAQKCSTPGHW